jgi:hypothetical protein
MKTNKPLVTPPPWEFYEGEQADHSVGLDAQPPAIYALVSQGDPDGPTVEIATLSEPTYYVPSPWLPGERLEGAEMYDDSERHMGSAQANGLYIVKCVNERVKLEQLIARMNAEDADIESIDDLADIVATFEQQYTRYNDEISKLNAALADREESERSLQAIGNHLELDQNELDPIEIGGAIMRHILELQEDNSDMETELVQAREESARLWRRLRLVDPDAE